MGHRKLIPQICQLICHGKQYLSCSSESDCKVCFKICLTNPQYPFYPPQTPTPTPPSPPQVPSSFYLDENEDHHHKKITYYLILALALLATLFFFICCRAIFTKLRLRRSRRVLLSSSSSPTQQTEEETRDDFLDEEHGPMVFHPIWYIRTVGLNQSVIKAINVCKYKKGEGLIEGTECSVCLSEFEEDESLRLLPKCHHAFHLPCIDTWLNSHTNCPMCRAPIVNNNNPSTASLESIVVHSSTADYLEHTQIQNSDETLENRGSGSELRNGAEEEEEEEEALEVEDGRRVCETERPVENNSLVSTRPRRSVSLDDTLVANINLALATILSTESNRVIGSSSINSKGSSSFRSPRYLQGVPSPMKRSSSHSGKYFLSWYSRSQKKPNAILRSV